MVVTKPYPCYLFSLLTTNPPTLHHDNFINKPNIFYLHSPVAQSFMESSFDQTIRLHHNNELSSAVSCNYHRKITDHPASP
ncbi:hypothetical protein CU097_010962 [Rhizopus azygosporus]|uniref:Uncharacterized protein n=1 Tax=Rhizopus azygosporus TaxID=86630 RepID=A0A367K441_RHIAZ|nr:hypothetical protein CU097_010962 [Rhizopus azygosporus]